MPKVSVIVPVYNVEKYLSQCLDSIINQTLKDIEIICVNDGSTDNSLEILKKYSNKDPKIKIISQKNKGLSAARNVGIKAAIGEYIGFVDSDDWIDNDFVEKLYNEAIKNQADIAVAGIKKYTTQKTKNLINIPKVIKTQKVSKKYEICNVPKYNYVWNKIYKRNMLKKSNILFEEGIKFEDVMFTHRILSFCNKVVTVPSIYYWYRVDNMNSITRQSAGEISKYIKKAFNEALNFIIKNNIKVKKMNRYVWDKEIKYSLLGLQLFKYREVDGCFQICLFKNIVIFEKKVIRELLH